MNCLSCTGIRYLEGNVCQTKCSLGLYGVLSSHTCESDCEDQYFQHDIDRLCYLICPSGFFGDVENKKCTSDCSEGRFSNPKTVRCDYCDFNCLNCNEIAKNCVGCKYSWLIGDECFNPYCNFFY